MNKKGATLLEILITIVVISIIAVVAVPNLKKFSENQILENKSLEVITTLNQAQSNASSGVKCAASPSLFWEVVMSEDKIVHRGICKPIEGENQNIEIKKTLLLDKVKLEVENCFIKDLPAVLFSGKSTSFYCSSALPVSDRMVFFGSQDFIINIKSQKKEQKIKINKSGVIQKL